MRAVPRWMATGSSLAALVLAATTSTAADPAQAGGHTFGQATLLRFAALPARTFIPAGEPSGAALGTAPINGVTPPFPDQPVQGFSGIVRNCDDTFDVLSDNGYGAQTNSADFALRIHRIAPNFTTGGVDVVGGINLADPDARVQFPLVRADRVLTGADFDPESVIREPGGAYWIGEEFGPFLLHVDRAGRLLQPPVPVPVCTPRKTRCAATPHPTCHTVAAWKA
jgi:hypothetical protein